MQTSWYKKVDGQQHWVQILTNPLRLEHTSDPVCELVGGGYFEIITGDDDSFQLEYDRLSSIFSEDETIEMIALARSLKRISISEIESLSPLFYQIYDEEYDWTITRLLE